MRNIFYTSYLFFFGILVILTLLFSNICFAQKNQSYNIQKTNISVKKNTNLFNPTSSFIQNIGQYGKTIKGYEKMGEVLFGYEGFNMPVLLTTHGIIYLQRKVLAPSKTEREELKRKGMRVEEIGEKITPIDKIITMEWLGSNPSPTIIAEGKQDAYHTYGFLKEKAFSFKKIIYKELYPGIDIVYSFFEGQSGYEYSLFVAPNADIRKVKVKIGGDVKSIILKNELIVQSEVGNINISSPKSYYSANIKNSVNIEFLKKKNEISFKVPNDLNVTKAIVIDPFVSSTGNFTGLNNNIAKDIDFDYAGNIYIAGGGDFYSHQLAKFDKNGVLQWTFTGSFVLPNWTFGQAYGGWTVEKSAGNIYLGQGNSNATSNTQVVRLNTAGVYDNYITDANPAVIENWRMIWSCNGNVPQIFMGGGALSNINIGIISPPSTTVSYQNITGIPTQIIPTPPFLIGNAQDVVDMIIDPLNNELYSIYASNFTPNLTNRIYKHQYPYNSSDKIWDTLSGFISLQEHLNRPYLSTDVSANDGSANLLALNSNYLFYWDGENLKAFNKSTGGSVNNSIIYNSNDRLERGGIIADACDNVFIGKDSGTIKVFHFTAANGFDDSPPDIQLPPPYNMDTTYDLAYDDSKKLLYACGSGFVASFDVSAYCASTIYTLNVLSDCAAGTATATVTPATTFPITYNLYTGNTFISSNTTGLFSGLVNGLPYRMVATINLACSGPQCTANFTLGNPISLTASKTNATCGNSNGTITANASLGTAPYQYSINNGLSYQNSNVFTNLAAGNYNVLAKDASTCGASSIPVTILQLDAPTLLPQLTHATCGNNNGAIIINTNGGGQTPYQYSINAGLTFQASNSFTNLAPGNYTIRVKDSNNCVRDSLITIYNGCLTANAVVTNTTCAGNDATITITANTGVAPYQYSIDNGVTYQSSNTFTGLTTGNYNIKVKDAIGATTSQTVTVALNNSITLTAGSPQTICEGTSATLNAVSNATSFVWTPSSGLNNPNILNPVASPIATTKYYITATTNICTKKDSVIITVNPAPIANAGKDSSICFGKNIRLTGSGGINYTWSPATYLNNPNIQNPTAVKPNTGIIKYSLKVTDANNCTSLNTAVVTIAVAAPAKLFAGNDTAVAINQPVQLYAVDISNSGFINYLWSPNYGLNNNTAQNPVAVLDRDITYFITASTINSCQGNDTIKIKVYKGPEIYVPNAFTPNGDGLNDILKAIPIGMKELRFFTIYNRYGQLIFTTKNAALGWDGKLKGSAQNTGTFTWMAEAVDYNNNIITRKGTVMLLR